MIAIYIQRSVIDGSIVISEAQRKRNIIDLLDYRI